MSTMYQGPSRISGDRADFPPFISHEDVQELKELDGSHQEIQFHEGKPVTHSRGTSAATRWAVGCLFVFIPGFLRHRSAAGLLQTLVPSFLRPGPGAEPKKLHPTAWLDGVRGLSAACVVVYHSTLVWFAWDIHLAPKPGEPMEFVKLPVIRFLIYGPPHVAIFFLVSGYAVSYKPLKLAHQGRYAEVGSTLASSFFRRHPRLFMPAAVVSFFAALMAHMGWYPTVGLPGVAAPTRSPPALGTLWGQLKHYALIQASATNPLSQAHAQSGVPMGENPYDPNLWTLPIEFSSSMVIFMFLAAFSHVRNRVRMGFALALLLFFECMWNYWAMFLFLSGMLICDLHFELADMNQDQSPSSRAASGEDNELPLWARVRRGVVATTSSKTSSFHLLGRVVGVWFFAVALWLLSAPGLEYTETLHTHVGAVLLILVVDHAPFLQPIFTNAFAQYLGKISYSIYLVHGPLLWTLGAFLGKRCVAITGSESDETYVLGIAMAAFLWWPVTIWISDLTYRGIDSKCVQFAKWAYEKLLKDDV